MIQDVERLSDNITRILDLAKFESKDYEGKFITTDVVKTVEAFYQNNIQLFRECEINIHRARDRSFTSKINPFLFEMLLMNLLTNAIKYNDSEVPRVDISFELEKERVHICFKDNGIGIGKSERKKIFKKFYQVGQSDDMTAKGSGLGLYLVNSIAGLHKGKVVAESNGIGKGSAFILILPFQTV